MDAKTLTRARDWLVHDPDPQTRAELSVLLEAAQDGDADAQAELADAFLGPLEFGTAGLRGRMGPGPRRMNEVVVARAAAGLAEYLRAHGGGSVVIGHDARRGSERFAHVSAEVLAGAGVTVLMLPAGLPTPVLAFAVRHLGCAAGVMVTASHNPPQDNGYKVYLGDGIQIVPPADREISDCIADVTARGPASDLPRSDSWTRIGEELLDAYVMRTAGLVEPGPPLEVRVAYTPVHGVGGRVFLRVMEQAGLPVPVVVESEFEPDPGFGGMPFPNPEEPGVMDEVLRIAGTHGCDVAIANDPDADRCAVAVPTAEGWRVLSGDEVGWLLGWWIATGNRRRHGRNVLAQSLVSGSMLEAIADDAGMPYAMTLTGFKWIARVPDLAFGYEEALGYCVDPEAVADKDGISAGLMVAELVGRLAQRGGTVLQVLDELARRHGVHATAQVSVRHEDPAYITALMSRLRTAPPTSIGGCFVEGLDDLEQPTSGLPATDGLLLRLADDTRVIVRPSGTEPKIKSYLQVREVVVDDDLDAARRRAARRLDDLAFDMRRLLA